MSCAYKREPQLILYVIIVLLHAPPNITGIYAYLTKLSKGTLTDYYVRLCAFVVCNRFSVGCRDPPSSDFSLTRKITMTGGKTNGYLPSEKRSSSFTQKG